MVVVRSREWAEQGGIIYEHRGRRQGAAMQLGLARRALLHIDALSAASRPLLFSLLLLYYPDILSASNNRDDQERESRTMAVLNKGAGAADPLVSRLVAEDKTPWYKKANLRKLYFWLFLCCMGVEMTSGFDSQLINALQFSPAFSTCTL